VASFSGFSEILANGPRQKPFTDKTTDSGPSQLSEAFAAQAVRIGSKGRTRRFLSPISGQNLAVFPRKSKLIFQNPAQLKNNSFATFTTRFTTHPFSSKNAAEK